MRNFASAPPRHRVARDQLAQGEIAALARVSSFPRRSRNHPTMSIVAPQNLRSSGAGGHRPWTACWDRCPSTRPPVQPSTAQNGLSARLEGSNPFLYVVRRATCSLWCYLRSAAGYRICSGGRKACGTTHHAPLMHDPHPREAPLIGPPPLHAQQDQIRADTRADEKRRREAR